MFRPTTSSSRRRNLLLALVLVAGILPLATFQPSSAAAEPVKTSQLTGTLPVPTMDWMEDLAATPGEAWLEKYCSATYFMGTKLCLVATAAGIVSKSADNPEARIAAVDARLTGFREELRKAGLLAAEGTPVGDPLEDRVPSESVLVPTVQPGPSPSGTSSATHVIEYAVPTTQSFPIDIKLGPDGALWYSMVTNNGTPGIGRIDPNTKAMAMFALPMETGITYAVNGGPGPYMWWTSIPFNGFGNKVGRINIETHEVENWEIPTPYSYPADLKVGPDGAIWFTETRAGKIGRFDPDDKTFAEFEVEATGVPAGDDGPGLKGPMTLPQDLAVIEDMGQPADTVCEGTPPEWEKSTVRWKDIFDGGACNSTGIWWSNQSPYTNGLGRIDPFNKEQSFYPYPTAAGLVLDISPGKDGRTVWYWYMGARYGGWYDPVTKVFTQVPTQTPPFLCCGGAGADNAMYWGEGHQNTVARYDLVSKEVTHIPVPSPRAIIIDFQLADGTVWFAEWRANKISEVVPDQRQELTDWPCGCAAPNGHPYNPDPISDLLEATRDGGIAEPSAW